MEEPGAYRLVLRQRDCGHCDGSVDRDADKANAVFMAAYAGDESGRSDYPALMFANRMLGGVEEPAVAPHPREGRLQLRRGQCAGGGDKSPFAQFMVQATAVPQNIPKVQDAFKDELAKF